MKEQARPGQRQTIDGQRIDKDYEIRFAVRKLALGLSLLQWSVFNLKTTIGRPGGRKRKTPGRALGRVKLRIMNRPKAGPDVF